MHTYRHVHCLHSNLSACIQHMYACIDTYSLYTYTHSCSNTYIHGDSHMPDTDSKTDIPVYLPTREITQYY